MRFGVRLPLFRSLSLHVTFDNARVYAAAIYLFAPLASIIALYGARHAAGNMSLKRHAVQSVFLFLFELMTLCGGCITLEIVTRVNVWLGCLALSLFLVPLLTRLLCALAAFMHPDGVTFPLVGSFEAPAPHAPLQPRPRVQPVPNHAPTRNTIPTLAPHAVVPPIGNTKPPAHKPSPSSVARPPTLRVNGTHQASDQTNAP